MPDGENPVGQEFLQPPSGPGPITFDKAHPYLDTRAAQRAGKQPTLRVADLTNPILQPWAREELRKVNERALTATVMFTRKERCWPIGVPGFLLYPVTPVYFLQTPQQVVMIWEEDHMARHVYLTDAHSPAVKPSWFGESIGHYENGDTLVVDTIGLNTRTFVDPPARRAHRAAACGRALSHRRGRQGAGSRRACRRPRRVHHAVECDAALPAGAARPRCASQVCAENNDKFFKNYDVDPIPQADKPDF